MRIILSITCLLLASLLSAQKGPDFLTTHNARWVDSTLQTMNPKYLFVDEPNSGLDPQTSIVIDELIEEITKEYNTTTVVITHDMNSVMGIADEIFFINDKQLMWQGTRDELLKSDNAALNEFIFAGSLMREVRKAIS